MSAYCKYGNCKQQTLAGGYCFYHKVENNLGRKIKILPKSERVCQFDGCNKKYECGGFCRQHYRMKRFGKELKPLEIRIPLKKHPKCKIDGCFKKTRCKGLCATCYSRQRPKNYQKQKYKIHKITVEKYVELLEKQNNVCAICEKVCQTGRRLAIDHDHETQQLRGLLCSRCNMGLGLFGDNSKLLIMASQYLENHKKKQIIKLVENVI